MCIVEKGQKRESLGRWCILGIIDLHLHPLLLQPLYHDDGRENPMLGQQTCKDEVCSFLNSND